LGRSRPGGRRARVAPSPGAARESPGAGAGPGPAPSLASAVLPRLWQGVGYRPLPDVAPARALFDFAAVPWPERLEPLFAWGAWTAGDGGERLIAAAVAERNGAAVFLQGPVVVSDDEPFEVAGLLVAASLDHASALGVSTVYARPLALDRVWVRFGFIPVPESSLPAGLIGRPGEGLYAWRGGSALWSLREPSGE
jgi:hypothetical protein